MQKQSRDVYRGKRIELVKMFLRQLESELTKLKKIKTITDTKRVIESYQEPELKTDAETQNEIVTMSKMNIHLKNQLGQK